MTYTYDGQKTCPKHVEFYSKNKFEKFVHLIGFIIMNYLLLVALLLSNSHILESDL